MISGSDRTFKLGMLLSVIDWLVFNGIFICSYLCEIYPFAGDRTSFGSDWLISNISYLIALQIITISLHHRMSQPAKVLSNTSRTSVLFILIYNTLLGMLQYDVPGFGSSLLMVFVVFAITSAERLVLRTFIQRMRNTGKNCTRTIIIGYGDMTQKAAMVMTDPWSGYRLAGFFAINEQDSKKTLEGNRPVPCLGTVENVMKYIKSNRVDEVYLSVTSEQISCYKELMNYCEHHMIRIFYIPETLLREFRNAKVKEFGNIYVMTMYSEPLMDIRKRILKRCFDFVVALLFLCTLFPFIFIIVAIISKITMPGPIFFKQKRTGYDGKDFFCYKFRSMKVNKDSDRVQAVKDDPRVTKWGLFMRHTNIDELPQFINVLKGDMSLVGPRPHMLAHTDYYSDLISDYMIRHYVKPGITGWAQTHGERGETKTVDDMKRRVEKDIWYIEHWSFWLDIQIMMKTITDVIHGDDKAY